ncbi:bifunctional 3-phenylpropionate/cinnamic acid dioxygenase ferredoxin subunit [Nocardiopsis sp. HNM0947]|uniref:Bifunctional 3-phenylpropionate/cinnamic acid dioxygenase ferredoxin subunit n=1 Tax=Nocardiopsis coralli TaxID=2772213 RepID=A0ABR9P139_9ACTN|nr:bifunctional 3-phenylpropionate/cinnamic acid dioxygenase ferredoxin subunit [Nocardiopsis coralli]MBE2997524.1 bifunctional 3-phenylpropionate/cinnamic acid dioxygenase ferredoxin subunit [Nocardiopsis coralli]
MTETVRAIHVGVPEDIEDGEAVVVPAERTGTGDGIAVFHCDGEFYALDDTCTHAEASLADGWIEDGEVECPMHSGRFCLSTGEALCMPATENARTHKVEIGDDGLWLHPGSST